jgi:hypothetical protein
MSERQEINNAVAVAHGVGLQTPSTNSRLSNCQMVTQVICDCRIGRSTLSCGFHAQAAARGRFLRKEQQATADTTAGAAVDQRRLAVQSGVSLLPANPRREFFRVFNHCKLQHRINRSI